MNMLSVVPTDKGRFRAWNDRLINAYTQYAGVKTRIMFKLMAELC